MLSTMKKLAFCLITIVFCICCAQTMYAAEDVSPAKTDQGYLSSALELEDTDDGSVSSVKLPNIFEVAFRFLISLVIIMALILAFAFVYRRFVGVHNFGNTDGKVIRVLAHKYLTQRKSIYILEVAQRVLVVAATEEHMELLTEIKDPNDLNSLYKRLDLERAEMQSKDFKQVLAGINEEGEGASSSQDAFSRSFNAIQSQIKKIKRMINEK